MTIPSGSFSNLEGSSTCTPCPIGFYSSIYQQSSCSPCQSGAITATIGSLYSGQCVVKIKIHTFSDFILW